MDFILNVFGETAVEAAFQQGVAEHPEQVENQDSPFITLAEVAASEVLPRTASGHPGTFSGLAQVPEDERKQTGPGAGGGRSSPAAVATTQPPSTPTAAQPRRASAPGASGSGTTPRQTGAGAVVGAEAARQLHNLGPRASSPSGVPPQPPSLFRDESDDRRFRRRRRRGRDAVGGPPMYQRSVSAATAGASSLASGLLQMRDLRAVDTAFTVSNVPALLVRRNALLVNMYTIKAIILSRKCFFFLRDGADGELLAMREWLCSGASPRHACVWGVAGRGVHANTGLHLLCRLAGRSRPEAGV